MIKLGTTLLFSDETDNFALKPVDEKMKDKYRNFMGNIVAVSLCDAMRILTCLFVRTTPKILNDVIVNFHVGERFKFAASQLFFNKPKPDWRFLDNALALSIFEYSKDTSTLTFFFIRHLINAFKYPEFMEHPDNAYKNYYTNIIDFRSSFYYAERIVTDTMNKFYEYITDMVNDLPEFPPNNMLTDLIPLPKEDSQLSRSITVTGKTFMFKYEYNFNVQKLNTIIPFEMFYPQKLDIIPLEIQCQDLDGNDYFMDPIIPRWVFMINNIIIIHPTTYRILYHTCQFAETYLFPFDNIRVPFFEKFRGSNGKLNFYGLIKSGMPIKVTDICTQAYLHGTREPFDKSVITGIEETREWLKAPHLLQIDYDSGLLHSTWKTICTILRARHEHGLLSKDDSKFQSISTDLMRRFRLHEFELDTNLKIYIPNPPLIPSPAYIPVAVLPYKK
uniref:Uncharacterized protein n=1 Tax=Panagrolaimus davidi TaxID=227884 RepID=A0A914PI69_9BILA